MQPIALIIGITGQDGSYLSDFLLEKKYKIYGVLRRNSTLSTQRIDHLFSNKNFIYMYGDMTDPISIQNIILQIKNDNDNLENHHFEIYNLAAQSHVKVSFDIPYYTAQVDALGIITLIETVKQLNISNKTRIYQASTSELFGKVLEIPQKETTPFNPQSPYAIAKQFAFWMCKNYRESYNMFICNGILFNHTSPKRGHTFVCRKITRAVANISKGKQQYITLGNLDAQRDWGHAKDYVKSMWLMLQQNQPDDYVISTNQTYSIRHFVKLSFKYVGINITWNGTGIDETAIDDNGIIRVKIDPKYFRPAEVDFLKGDSSKAREKLGWIPEYSLDDIIREMIDRDLKYDSIY